MIKKRTVRRRATFLTEMIILVPIIGATMTLVYQVSIRSMRVQSQTARSLAITASRDDLLRRIGEDAATAVSATLEQTDGAAAVLTLQNHRSATQPAEENATALPQVAYRVTGSHVTRIEQPRIGSPTEYKWNLDPVDVNLNLETIANKPRIVWISFVKKPSDGDTPMPPSRVLTAAATINRGGAR